MKKITKYLSDDGFEFVDQNECFNHEAFAAECNSVSGILGSRDEIEGLKTLQHSEKDFVTYRNRVADLCISIGMPVDICNGFRTVNNILLRYLSDGDGPKNALLWRLARRCDCTDENFEEWEQPYYAINGTGERHRGME